MPRSRNLLVLVFALLSGCTSLSRGGAAGAARYSVTEESDEEEFEPGETAAGQTIVPPGTEEVTWEDNGVAIREISGPGKPKKLNVPDSNVQKKAAPKAAPKVGP